MSISERKNYARFFDLHGKIVRIALYYVSHCLVGCSYSCPLCALLVVVSLPEFLVTVYNVTIVRITYWIERRPFSSR
jgi:hypothetical protein